MLQNNNKLETELGGRALRDECDSWYKWKKENIKLIPVERTFLYISVKTLLLLGYNL
jgi:hypothetical protein